ncbi:MAG: hypothetical protein IVW54_15505 [Candidatus Binataceae bacterium]|nr:hypothetical protein [Candidatus Binataceae bacterium]
MKIFFFGRLLKNQMPISRRTLLQAGLIATTAGAGNAIAAAIPAPRESGLSFEGLLKHQPGFQPRQLAPLNPVEVPGFLSRPQLEQSYAVYRTAFANLLAIEKSLASASRDPDADAEYARLRRDQVTAANSVLLHEFYFRNLVSKPAAPSSYVLANMNEHMGSIESWRNDFIACARIAEAWAVLEYDPYDDRWHNAALGNVNGGGWIGANPLIVCAVADYAWSVDYKDRSAYVTAFLEHLNWTQVAERYRSVDRH